MTTILVGTSDGCRVFDEGIEKAPECSGHQVLGLTKEDDSSVLAIIDCNEVWHPGAGGAWSRIAKTNEYVLSLLALNGKQNRIFSKEILAGGLSQPLIVRISQGMASRLIGFDQTPGHADWIPNGPPLQVRSLAQTADSLTLFAVVHVGAEREIPTRSQILTGQLSRGRRVCFGLHIKIDELGLVKRGLIKFYGYNKMY